jgi:hypothetical protein
LVLRKLKLPSATWQVDGLRKNQSDVTRFSQRASARVASTVPVAVRIWIFVVTGTFRNVASKGGIRRPATKFEHGCLAVYFGLNLFRFSWK